MTTNGAGCGAGAVLYPSLTDLRTRMPTWRSEEWMLAGKMGARRPTYAGFSLSSAARDSSEMLELSRERRGVKNWWMVGWTPWTPEAFLRGGAILGDGWGFG